jgi:hypothetical protein
MTTATAEATSATRIATVRSFVRGKRHRPWYDWYAIGFGIALALLILSDFLNAPFSRLMAAGGPPAQAAAGAALVIAAAAGLLMLAQVLGPLALSPADASWLLLSPLRRRDVLRRPATTAAVISALAGALLGVLALAMAGPYLRHGPRHALWSWLLPSAVSGAGFFAAATLAAMLAQPRPRWRSWLRVCCAVVSIAAGLGALAGERWTALPRHVTGVFADLSTTAILWVMAVAVAIMCAVALLLWRALPRFPAGLLSSDSARAGRTLLAVTFLNVPLLTWIAEDSHWRGRQLTARPWPDPFRTRATARSGASPSTAARPAARTSALAAAWTLAWVDWRRLGRRPALLLALAASTLAPALAGGALTGQARGYGTAAVLLCGGIAAGVQGTAATRRDANDPTLFRLLGVNFRTALRMRAILPALLATGWLLLSLTLLVLARVLTGWLWPLLGLLAGPGLAAAALRIARTGAISPAEQGPDTPLGPVPPWLISRVFSVLLGGIACYPLLRAVYAGHAHTGTLTAQLAVSAIVLGGYLMLSKGTRPAG